MLKRNRLKGEQKNSMFFTLIQVKNIEFLNV